jgi:hypothetical protein
MSDAPAKDSGLPPTSVAPTAASSSASAHGHAPATGGAVSSAPDAPAKDVVLLGPPTADGAGVHVIRARDERIETGELRAIQEGKPITGEIVTLAPRKDNPRVCDVKDSYVPPAMMSHKGPAKVATDAYREGWDSIFGSTGQGAKKSSKPTGAAN